MNAQTPVTLTHAVRWDQVLTNPAIGTHSGDQTATVQGGTLALPEGWRAEFHYENPQPTPAEWNGDTRIVRIDVFNENGQMAFAYKPMNPGQYARIQPDLSGVGDCFARLDLSVMVSNDPGAPRLGSVVITNGKNSFVDLPQTFPRGNGAYDLTPSCPVPCFGPDTLVYTWERRTRMADVQQGDMIWCMDFATNCVTFGRVLWKGMRIVKADEQNAPVLFRDELFSPQHRIIIRDGFQTRWIKAKFLAELGLATQTPADGRDVEYHHVLMQHHCAISTGACLAESLLNTETTRALFAGHSIPEGASETNQLTDVARHELVRIRQRLNPDHPLGCEVPEPLKREPGER